MVVWFMRLKFDNVTKWNKIKIVLVLMHHLWCVKFIHLWFEEFYFLIDQVVMKPHFQIGIY